MNVIHEIFAGRLIFRNGEFPWSNRLPDLSPCDFFLWGCWKSKVYQGKPRIISEFKKAIYNKKLQRFRLQYWQMGWEISTIDCQNALMVKSVIYQE